MSEHVLTGDALHLEIADQVATVVFHSPSQKWAAQDAGRVPEVHSELVAALQRARDDAEVRVVVLTGAEDGYFLTSGYSVVRPAPHPASTSAGFPPGYMRTSIANSVRQSQLFLDIEKPVIARVNGDVVGVGVGIAFACDIIVARADARIVDTHMAMDDAEPYRGNCIPPGDGGGVFLAAYLSPALAKEALLLGRTFTAQQLADVGAINYAVPMERLDEQVDDLTRRFIKRDSSVLALAKRTLNRSLANEVGAGMDTGAGYLWASVLEA
jgi:enoyl-CoA hydratase